MKKILSFFLISFSFALASDITATTSDGRIVILHDNGRWEYYQNNKKIRDVRESAIPKDMKFEVSIRYETYETLRKNMEMYLTALEFSEEAIKILREHTILSITPGGRELFGRSWNIKN